MSLSSKVFGILLVPDGMTVSWILLLIEYMSFSQILLSLSAFSLFSFAVFVIISIHLFLSCSRFLFSPSSAVRSIVVKFQWTSLSFHCSFKLSSHSLFLITLVIEELMLLSELSSFISGAKTWNKAVSTWFIMTILCFWRIPSMTSQQLVFKSF